MVSLERRHAGNTGVRIPTLWRVFDVKIPTPRSKTGHLDSGKTLALVPDTIEIQVAKGSEMQIIHKFDSHKLARTIPGGAG